MSSSQNAIVIDRNGLRGTVDKIAPPHESAAGSQVQVRLENGGRVSVPARALIGRDDGTFYFAQSLEDFQLSDGTVVVPVLEEELEVHKRRVESGGVRVTKTVHEREELVDQPLLMEEAEVERVPVNRLVDGPVAVRYEGDTMIVPLLEEVLVVEKRLVLKEELRITKRRSETHQPQRVILRSEEAVVERMDGRERQSQDIDGAAHNTVAATDANHV